jgi:AcrR family transcriptional regulator
MEATDSPTTVSTLSTPALRAPGRPRDQRATEAITEAALRQLDELGYGGISMESVACEAGVARATVYRRYRDKADLVTAAIAERAAQTRKPEPSEDPRRDLAQFLVDFEDRFNQSCIEVLGCLLGDRDDPHALALCRERVIAPQRAYALSLLEHARRLGQLRPDADLSLALNMLVGVVVVRAVHGAASAPGWVDKALDAVWTAMGPVAVLAQATTPAPSAMKPVPPVSEA